MIPEIRLTARSSLPASRVVSIRRAQASPAGGATRGIDARRRLVSMDVMECE
jgi:hypothetical protein